MRVTTKRRIATALLLAAGVTGSAGVLGIPAYGQSAGVGNSGGASASTGGNASVGNSSDNTATNTDTLDQTSEPLLGGLLGLVLNVGNSSTNESSGTSTVSTGGAAATGNTSDTAVAQTGDGGGVTSVFGHFAPAQSAGVSNSGEATASTGGNRSVGNDSTNVATNTQTVTGGLLAIGINLGNASNVSSGSSSITTGPAAASGNEAVTTVHQVSVGEGFGVGGGAVCDGFFRFGGQHVEVDNSGVADAATGNNQSVGNQSINTATNNQLISGGLVNLPIDLGLTAAATNSSDGTSAIVTGPATATGNRSTTAVSQQDCVDIEPVSLATPTDVPHPHHKLVKVIGKPVVTHQLATTGVDPFVLGVIAFSLLFGGLLFLVWERVESLPSRTATS
ncbi:MAG: hypothetical protein ABR540_00230 [Acidimicrobiales bacterium]